MPLALSNRQGTTFVSTLIAAAIIVVALGGIGASALRMGWALKKAEVANMALAIEANLVASFQDKKNYPQPSATNLSPNHELRAGTLKTLNLQVSFGEGIPDVTIPVPVNDGTSGVEGYLDEKMVPCTPPAFSPKCILHYEIRLRKSVGATVSYAFSYKVDANPDVLTMAPLGDITEFSVPIDPGNYRASEDLTHCNSAEDLFVTAVNRDTGQVFCAKKPALNSCPKNTLAKGLRYVKYESGNVVIELDCTTKEMRRFKCPDNYSLQKFNAQYIDPENESFAKAPGKCVFITSHTEIMQARFPENPSAPYMKSVSGTFCSPFYAASSNGSCNLVPDSSKNTNPTIGLGKCAPTKHKNCQRSTYTKLPDGTTSCNQIQTSPSCDGVASTAMTCATAGTWDNGIPYADATQAYAVAPTANPIGVAIGRKLSCTYQDTSAPCMAPDQDINGAPWGKKDPKWYGGVQVTNVQCTYDNSFGAEVVDAI